MLLGRMIRTLIMKTMEINSKIPLILTCCLIILKIHRPLLSIIQRRILICYQALFNRIQLTIHNSNLLSKIKISIRLFQQNSIKLVMIIAAAVDYIISNNHPKVTLISSHIMTID